MFRKALASALVILVLNCIGGCPVKANPRQKEDDHQIEKAKENIRRLGTGPEARVEVKLQDNRKLKGYIKEAGEDSFIVVDKTGTASRVDYSQVKQIKGSNRLTAAKVGLTIAKGALIVAAVAGAFTLLLALTIPRT